MPTTGPCTVRQARTSDAPTVVAVLLEAARWLESCGMPMWRDDELSEEQVVSDVAAGLFHLAECQGEPAGIVKFQLTDPLFWPDMPEGDAAYLHRFAVRRNFAGAGVSTTLLRWAVNRTAELNRPFLRLDCEAARPRLRAVYERFGFKHHSDRQVGPYFVARYEYALSLSGPRPWQPPCDRPLPAPQPSSPR